MKKILAASAAGVALLCAIGCGAPEEGVPASPSAQEKTANESRRDANDCWPALPSPTLAVPAGNELAFHFDAQGFQIYDCKANATGAAWVFRAPDAKLYRHHQQVGTHYAGPTWEYKDGSTVVGTKLAAFTQDPTAVPSLLLQGTAHTGDGKMSEVTYIQRLNTVGGIAPASGCDATTIGAVANVPYSATYYFYEAAD